MTLFMLAPSHYSHNEIVALDRAYINYAKFEELTDRGVVYVTKMKSNLHYEVLVDLGASESTGLMEYREQVVVFRKDGIKPHSQNNNIRRYPRKARNQNSYRF